MKTNWRNESCREWRDLMLDRLEGVEPADGRDAGRLDAHLADCANCRREFETLKGTLGLLERRRAPAAAEPDWDEMHRRVRRVVHADASARGRRLLPLLSGAAVLLLLVFAVFWGAGRLGRDDGHGRVLAQIEAAGRQGLAAGGEMPSQLLDSVLAEDYPLDEDLDLLIEDLSSAELSLLSARLETLKG